MSDKMKLLSAELREMLDEEHLSYLQLPRLQELLGELAPVADKLPRLLARAETTEKLLIVSCQEDMTRVGNFLQEQHARSPVRIQHILASATQELIDSLQCLYVADLDFGAEGTDPSILCSVYLLLEYADEAHQRWNNFDLDVLCSTADEGSRASDFLLTALNASQREDKSYVLHQFLRKVYLLDHGTENAAQSDHVNASHQLATQVDAELYYSDLHTVLHKFEALAKASDLLESATRSSTLVQSNTNIQAVLLQKACVLAMAEKIATIFELKDTREAYMQFVSNMAVQLRGVVPGQTATAVSSKKGK